ncbi:MAG: DUF72 domain-containing protein [Elusimicrobia bacterium]|nr:DUF72 domain-containing protein [Elusimicrobiota bacterium]
MRVGCGRFAVARARYFATLTTVEVGPAFVATPRPATLERWRSEAPRDFDFSLPVSQIVTHPASSSGYARILSTIPERRRGFCGHFKPTAEVASAWERTRAAAGVLGAKFLLFETPTSFYPDANHLRDMYNFFKGLRRGPWTCVWQPRGAWSPRLLEKVSGDLGLVRARDPFQEPELPREACRYLRTRAERLSERQMALLRRLFDEGPARLYLLGLSAWPDARRLAEGR